MKKILVGVVIALALSACSLMQVASDKVNVAVFDLATAQRDVFAAKEGYGVAERLATAYARLARCQVPAVQPCSSQVVVDQITKARNIARDSLAAGQTAVDTPGFGSEVISTSLTAMKASLIAFQSISNKYGTK